MSAAIPATPAVAPTPTYSPPSLPSPFQVDVVTVTRARLHRVYWNGKDPLDPAVKGNNRYDCPAHVPAANEFGVLYLGYEAETCWLETVVRDAVVRPAGAPIPIKASKMTARWACEVLVQGTLTLATFRDESARGDLPICATARIMRLGANPTERGNVPDASTGMRRPPGQPRR
ncbi:RES domain-containing protein [Variovorax sp. J22P271]|uniref:RES domain-containing protein n=1 Tax=Variovorax davisae TaxID=3053515 RepID=UPI0025750110|nr:RES domain-containing protein [Variovorax sp. J22P271]MDM0032844.1 RES domain-containing protein [Variovorax sp. J22P271]